MYVVIICFGKLGCTLFQLYCKLLCNTMSVHSTSMIQSEWRYVMMSHTLERERASVCRYGLREVCVCLCVCTCVCVGVCVLYCRYLFLEFCPGLFRVCKHCITGTHTHTHLCILLCPTGKIYGGKIMQPVTCTHRLDNVTSQAYYAHSSCPSWRVLLVYKYG